MKNIHRVYIMQIFLICTVLMYSMPSFAQGQYIAESFGLASRGIEYYHQGYLYEAKKILERAVRLDPRNDEAEGYLDLVNAELRMRAKGKLNVYQTKGYLKRERDSTYQKVGVDVLAKHETGEETEYKNKWTDVEPEEVVYYSDEEDGPSEGYVWGEYKMSLGFTSEDVIWKKANGDYNERNFRMIDHQFPKTNTFDTRVYDSFKVVFDTNKEDSGINFHSDITVDPWSFVGKTDKFTVGSNAPGVDNIELELKYWSGTRSIINETYYTKDYSWLLNIPEYKVTDGKIPAFTVDSKTANFTMNTYSIPEQDIDFIFQPVRELWFDFKDEGDFKIRIFPFGLEDQALTSDDPLGLSNHHIYWEPSPWLDDWIPGQLNTGWNPDVFWRGQWSDDLSFFTRDSNLKRLTALRGVSLENSFGNTDLSMTIATPKTLWQDYDSITAIPGALRLKTQVTDGLAIGVIDTFRIGYDGSSVDSYNNVFGLDVSYDLDSVTNIVGEVAVSKSEYDRTSDYADEKDGFAAHLGLTKETGIGEVEASFTHMDEEFDPGLANYRETRRDQFWSRHIHFKEPLKYSSRWGGSSLTYEDIKPFRIGDGVDTGRNAFNFKLKSSLCTRVENLISYRYVRDTNHKYVEGVFREENTFNIDEEWTSKLLFIYHDLPKTKGGIDPIYYDSDTGDFLINSSIEDGKDPSVSTYSFGLEYAPRDWISIFGIYENTNDFTFATGDNPRGLLNEKSFTTNTIDGNSYREKLPYLYSQGFFDLPPYERFNIYRLGVSLKPWERLEVDFDFTKNDFKFAQGIDDNINHFGTTLKYEFTPKLTGFLKYTFSKAYNLYRLNTSGDLDYQDHHNVFMELNYNVNEDALLIVQFGEGSVVSPVWGATASPFGDFYPTLDTQHILRVYYQGRF